MRVEDPATLAGWVLSDEPGWDGDRIVAAMSARASSRVELTRPIRVILFYSTAVVMSEDGTMHFAEDIYQHDAHLIEALVQARQRS